MPVFCVVAALALRRDQQKDSDNDAGSDFGLNSTPRYSSACGDDPDRPGVLGKGPRGMEEDYGMRVADNDGVAGEDGLLSSSSPGVPLLQGGAAAGGSARGELSEFSKDGDQEDHQSNPFSA